MEPHELLLVLLEQAGGEGRPVDPVKIQKGAFIACQEAAAAIGQPFEFRAYDFGPCSFDIYRVLDGLVADGLAEAETVAGRSWKRYSLTDAGRRAVAEVEMAPNVQDFFGRLGPWLSRQTFRSLLRQVYERYPDFAKNSVVSELAPRK